MNSELADAQLREMSHSVPSTLVNFGRALDSACVLVDGWPYFLTKSWKWANEYTAWAEAGFPQDGEDGWPQFMDDLNSVAT